MIRSRQQMAGPLFTTCSSGDSSAIQAPAVQLAQYRRRSEHESISDHGSYFQEASLAGLASVLSSNHLLRDRWDEHQPWDKRETPGGPSVTSSSARAALPGSPPTPSPRLTTYRPTAPRSGRSTTTSGSPAASGVAPSPAAGASGKCTPRPSPAPTAPPSI